MSTNKFALGRVVATPAAMSAADAIDGGTEVVFVTLIRRHQCGDWSEMDAEDRTVNEDAVRVGNRILSAYTMSGVKFWVITEWDRSVTTILLPEDY